MDIGIISELFRIYGDAAKDLKKGLTIFPFAYHKLLQEADDYKARIRLVTDLIASMTEEQAVRIYLRLTGISSGSALDALIR
jgi:dGTP triphosphohydrolase